MWNLWIQSTGVVHCVNVKAASFPVYRCAPATDSSGGLKPNKMILSEFWSDTVRRLTYADL